MYALSEAQVDDTEPSVAPSDTLRIFSVQGEWNRERSHSPARSSANAWHGLETWAQSVRFNCRRDARGHSTARRGGEDRT